MHMLKSGKKAELAAELGVEPNEISLEGSEVTLATFDEFEDLGEIVSGPAFSHWFGGDRDGNYGGWDVDWRYAEDYADEELEDLMVKVAEK